MIATGPAASSSREATAFPSEPIAVLLGAPVGGTKRPPDAQRLIDQILGGVVTDQDIHLIRPLAEHDVRRSAATGEAVEARPLHRYESLERCAARLGGCAPGRADGAPADYHHNSTISRDPVCRDRAAGWFRVNAGRTDDK
jgi:hypothetical protein